jgi:hypothetical protein
MNASEPKHMEIRQEEVNTLIQELNDRFVMALAKLSISKTRRDCLTDGYKDGVRAGVYRTLMLLEIPVIPVKES